MSDNFFEKTAKVVELLHVKFIKTIDVHDTILRFFLPNS